ncbi:hypothetical protein GM661_02570 [Iocasia frigidifontis]|uniref:Uncharacterized protein n=1 Tax=Iocasia fonsfrigidae TaxID=2682810 RepID=A0A8A7KDG5_9FIRM|nr:hypothetical protein [Iocasia fonsfrigidae]QTL96937.1 hypothetical protein GM661_02570 [Iocasia fonsfrigidae]
MEVIVHGIDIELPGEKVSIGVGEIFDKIQAQGSVVYQVIADGQDITNYTEEEFEDLGVIEHLEIVARGVKELTLETIKEAENFVPEFIERIEKFIVRINDGTETARFIMIEQLLETLDWLNTLLENIRSIVDEKETVDLEQNEFFTKWKGTMVSLSEGIEKKDLVLISDVLEYELIPVLEEYQQYVRVTNEKII